jgi:TIGR03009 family protein
VAQAIGRGQRPELEKKSMRHYRLALAVLLLVGMGLQAQQPPQPFPSAQNPNGAAAPSRLDELLARWEKEMQSVTTLTAEITRTMKDKVWQSDEVFVGKAKYMKPNLAIMELQKKNNGGVFEKYLCTGSYLYQWVPSSKAIHVYELPTPKAGQPQTDDNFLSFFFGMKAEEAKKRYELKLVKDTDKENPWYIYIEVLPKLPVDKADFSRARLVLNASNFLPRQVWFEQPNGNELTWDLPKVDRDVRIDRSEFAPPTAPPAGWNMVKVPRADAVPRNDVKPTVVRPNER